MHAWLGIWGAVMGLLFGFTGLLLNHRATMKIPGVSYTNTQWQLKLPRPLPSDIDALSGSLQQELRIDRPPYQKKVEPSGPTPWPGAVQPERWSIVFATPRETVNAEYWVGNESVAVRRMDPNLLAWLSRLHMATGRKRLMDTADGHLGRRAHHAVIDRVLLWTRLHGPRLLAMGLAGTCFVLLLTLAATGW